MTMWQCSVVSFFLMSTNFHGLHDLQDPQSNAQQRVENIPVTTIGIDKAIFHKIWLLYKGKH